MTVIQIQKAVDLNEEKQIRILFWINCCILYYAYTYMNIDRNIMTNFNEWTNTLLHRNIPLTLYSQKGDVSCVWEVSWRRGQTATYWPQVLLSITALLSHSGWAAQPWVTEGPSPLSGPYSHSAGILSPTDSNCNWNWPKLSVASGYIIVSHPPASAVPPIIYTGASLDWRLGRESIYNKMTTNSNKNDNSCNWCDGILTFFIY